jgi:hypothetical protein
MKIMRVINNVPIEFELTQQEIFEFYAEVNSQRLVDNLLYVLESEADNDDPDTTDPYSAKVMLETLKRCPKFAEKVAAQFEDLLGGLRSDEEANCARDAYIYMLRSWEVCK